MTLIKGGEEGKSPRCVPCEKEQQKSFDEIQIFSDPWNASCWGVGEGGRS